MVVRGGGWLLGEKRKNEGSGEKNKKEAGSMFLQKYDIFHKKDRKKDMFIDEF